MYLTSGYVHGRRVAEKVRWLRAGPLRASRYGNQRSVFEERLRLI